MERAKTKRRVDALFMVHAGFCAAAGSLAFLLPHLFEWFAVHHGEQLALRDNTDDAQKVTHLITRLYGALILAQVSARAKPRARDFGSFNRVAHSATQPPM